MKRRYLWEHTTDDPSFTESEVSNFKEHLYNSGIEMMSSMFTGAEDRDTSGDVTNMALINGSRRGGLIPPRVDSTCD